MRSEMGCLPRPREVVVDEPSPGHARRTIERGPGTVAATTTSEHTLTEEQVVFAFGPDMAPAVEVDPGAVVTLRMKDGLGNQLTREDQLIHDVFTDLDLSRVNGSTGPVAVRGAEPGDSLMVEILDIRPASSGVAFATPGIGQLHEQLDKPVTRIFRIDNGTIHMND